KGHPSFPGRELKKADGGVRAPLEAGGFEAVHGVDEGVGYALFRDGMARVGDDDEFGLGECAVQVPGGGHRANDVVAALDDNDRRVEDLIHVCEEVVIAREE